MSIKVYTLLDVVNSSEYHTKYVRHEDYAALEAHCKMVEANLKEIEERLRDAAQERRFNDR
jgi:hypothetical protein